jgi:dGTPase
VDDGLRSGLITLEQLAEVGVFARHLTEVKSRYPQLEGRRLIHETIRRMINSQVQDLCNESRRNIAALQPAWLDDVRQAGPLIAFSEAMQQEQHELKHFLRVHLYRHYRVNRMSSKARRILRELFGAFHDDPSLMPEEFQVRAGTERARAVADYIAGMTDRYAIREYRRLFTVEELPL